MSVTYEPGQTAFHFRVCVGAFLMFSAPKHVSCEEMAQNASSSISLWYYRWCQFGKGSDSNMATVNGPAAKSWCECHEKVKLNTWLC